MRIGVPKEIKVEEYRVGLTPASVREYVTRGHEVIVEQGAGIGIGAGDQVYRSAGGAIVDTASAVRNSTRIALQRAGFSWRRP